MSGAIAIDEVSLTWGELYTIVSYRIQSGRKVKLIAVLTGTKAKDFIADLSKLPKSRREKVQEFTLDMSPSMRKACESLYIYIYIYIYIFQAHGSLSLGTTVRRGHAENTKTSGGKRKENRSILRARKTGKEYKVQTFSNGDTPKQLLGSFPVHSLQAAPLVDPKPIGQNGNTRLGLSKDRKGV